MTIRSPLLPLVTVSNESVVVIAFSLPYPAGGALAYSVIPIGPSTVETRTIPLQFGEASLLYQTLIYHSVATQRGTGIALGPTVAGIPGEGFLRDPGFLGWRDYGPSPTLGGFTSIPAIVIIDATNGTARLVPFTGASYRPDSLLDVASAAIITVLGTVSLSVAYPRWRSTRRHHRQA